MHTALTYFAAATAEKAGLFESLGIDLKTLIMQSIAFLLLLWLLSKYVYPVLTKMLDDRDRVIEESTKAAVSAEKKARDAEKAVEKQLADAKHQASEIVATAKAEATSMITRAEESAKKRGDHIVEEARAEVEKSIIKARKDLEKDTLALVKKASSLATAGIADSKLDTALIKKSVEEAKS